MWHGQIIYDIHTSFPTDVLATDWCTIESRRVPASRTSEGDTDCEGTQMSDDGGPNDRSPTLGRRKVLLGTVGSATIGLGGCVGSLTGGGCGTISAEGPDGSACVTVVEDERSIEDYYGFDTEVNNSSNVPDGLEARDATVTFVYRNETTGDRHLVVIHDHPEGETDGAAAMTFEGVGGYRWTVQDDPPAENYNDRYGTPEESFGASESVAWQWGNHRTDGGAIGPLDDSFDIDLIHQQEGTVGDVTVSRTNVDRWLVIDGADPDNPVELVDFTDGTSGDVSLRVSE